MAVSGLTSDFYGSYYTYNYGYNNSTNGLDSSVWGENKGVFHPQSQTAAGI